MAQVSNQDGTIKDRIRALRRARRFIRANQRPLARILNTYQHVVTSETMHGFWVER